MNLITVRKMLKSLSMVPWPVIHSSAKICTWEEYDGENWLYGQTEDRKAHMPSGTERLGLFSPVKKG